MDSLKKICDCYAKAWLDKGAYEIHFNECATGYIQSFAIRSLCAGYKLVQNENYREAAKKWADLTLRLQGTQGHPDAYNMGYQNTIRSDGVPQAWYPADCGDIALAILDTATILEKKDPMKNLLLDSVVRYTDYVLEYWSNDDGSVGGYIEDFKEYHYNFWCADSRMCNVLWGLIDILEDETYLKRAIDLTHHSTTIDLYRKDKEGNKLEYNYSLAVYMPDAICNSLGHLVDEHQDIQKECLRHLQERFFKWAVNNQTSNGTWIKKKSGLEEESVGGYHGCLLANLMLAKQYLKPTSELEKVSTKALTAARKVATSAQMLESPNKWGVNATLGLGLAAAIEPVVIFPKVKQ